MGLGEGGVLLGILGEGVPLGSPNPDLVSDQKMSFSTPRIQTRPLKSLPFSDLAPVVQKVDSAIHWINLYPLDRAIGFPKTYPLDRDLSGGQRYPHFEQLGPGP